MDGWKRIENPMVRETESDARNIKQIGQVSKQIDVGRNQLKRQTEIFYISPSTGTGVELLRNGQVRQQGLETPAERATKAFRVRFGSAMLA
jgi:hypothetical protein